MIEPVCRIHDSIHIHNYKASLGPLHGGEYVLANTM